MRKRSCDAGSRERVARLSRVKLKDARVLGLAVLVAQRHAVAIDLRLRRQLRPALAVLLVKGNIVDAQMRLLKQYIGKAEQRVRAPRSPFLADDRQDDVSLVIE